MTMGWTPYQGDTNGRLAEEAREREAEAKQDNRYAAAAYIERYVREKGWTELDRLEILGALDLLPEDLATVRDSYGGREIPTVGPGSGRGLPRID